MTTSVTIKNNGPAKVRIRHRNISLSARKSDSDSHEQVLDVGQSTLPHEGCIYDTRKLIIEEVA